MALSGSFTGTTNNEYITPKITWSATQSTVLNASEVTATLSYTRTNSGYETYGTWIGSITIGGKKLEGTKSVTITNGTYTEVITHKATIYHNSDGTKTITISALGAISGTTLSKTTISKSITLDTIPRASSITCTSAVIEQESTIKINRASSAFTHTITYSFGSLRGTIATKTTATTVYWQVPISFYEELGNNASGTVTLTCTTYNGTSTLGTRSINVTVTMGSDVAKPTLAPKVYDTDEYTIALTGDRNIIIQNYNNVYVETGAEPSHGATLTIQTISDGSETISAASGYFENTDSNSFTVSAKDNRGYIATQTISKTLIPYVKPTCNLTAKNPDTSGSISFEISGRFFNESFGAQTNTILLHYRVKEEDNDWGEWVAIEPTITDGNYKIAGTVEGLDYKNKYTLQARVADLIHNGTYKGRVNSSQRTVKAVPVFDWGANDFAFNVPVVFNAGFTNNGEVEEPEEEPEDNVVLWSGGYYMTEGQTATLSAPVSAQKSGIVLIFSRYDIANSSVMNEHFSSHYVPKQLVALHEGKGSVFTMSTVTHSFTASKYLYIYNDRIEGNENNDLVTGPKGTQDDDVVIENNKFVLRYVIGV